MPPHMTVEDVEDFIERSQPYGLNEQTVVTDMEGNRLQMRYSEDGTVRISIQD